MSQKQWKLAVLPGDGIGPEVTRAALSVLDVCAGQYGFSIEKIELPFGGAAIDACGQPLPQETLDACLKSDAVLLGAVGGPRWDPLPLGQRPEAGLLGSAACAGALCQCAADLPARAAARAFSFASCAGRAREFRNHPRADRRHLFRRAQHRRQRRERTRHR